MEVVFEHVSFSYNRGLKSEKKALDNVNLYLQSGLIHGIIGPIGSGKTTLLELMNGITKPDCGDITVGTYTLYTNGFNFNKFRYDVGLVYQLPEKQFFCNTVGEEVAFSEKIYSSKKRSIKNKVIKALKMVGLDESYISRSPFLLNGGEKRLVAIASVLISNPKLLILDEPTIGLDNKCKKRLIKIIKKLKERYSKTIIIVTHDVDMLYEMVDNVVVLNNGCVVKEGPKIDVFADTEFLNKNNTPIPSIIKFERLFYDKTGIDLGFRKNTNDLIRGIVSVYKEDGDYDE